MINIYHLSNDADRAQFNELINSKHPQVFDEMEGQLRELIKCLNPSRRINDEDYPELITEHLKGTSIHDYGVWVYYPWNNRLVHCLDEEEFIEVRTNRNRQKITKEEQAFLKTQKIGVIGLSVGQSIALTLVMERLCGELRLADFDVAELSNLNRIRTGIHNLGVNKTLIAAHEILEIDPFIKIKLFPEGLTDANMDEFYTGDGKLDLLVEVCDSIDIKLLSRFKAKELRIPVVMDTNDRGMMDVERFDLEPERPILHGFAGDLDPAKLKGLTNEQKLPYIFKIVGVDKISTRLKASMIEMGQTISTWPQLASSVVLGGALTADVARRILLNEYHDSGRYYIDLDELIADKEPVTLPEVNNPFKPMERKTVDEIAAAYINNHSASSQISFSDIQQIVTAATSATSPANSQPWKWYFSHGVLLLIHDESRSWSWEDANHLGTYVSFGATLEKAHLKALELNLQDNLTVFPALNEPRIIAAITYEQSIIHNDNASIVKTYIYNTENEHAIDKTEAELFEFLEKTQYFVKSYGENIKLFEATDKEDIRQIADIIAATERIKLLNKEGHKEYYNNIRWSKEDAIKTGDGILIEELGLSQAEMASLMVAKDWDAVSLLADWNKGSNLKNLSFRTAATASAYLLVAIPQITPQQLLYAGKLVQDIWTSAENHGITIQPVLTPILYFNRNTQFIDNQQLTDQQLKEKEDLSNRWIKIFPLNMDGKRVYSEVYLLKFTLNGNVNSAPIRKPVDEIFYYLNDNN